MYEGEYWQRPTHGMNKHQDPMATRMGNTQFLNPAKAFLAVSCRCFIPTMPSAFRAIGGSRRASSLPH